MLFHVIMILYCVSKSERALDIVMLKNKIKNRIKQSCASKGIAKDYSVCICSGPTIGSIGDTCHKDSHNFSEEPIEHTQIHLRYSIFNQM